MIGHCGRIQADAFMAYFIVLHSPKEINHETSAFLTNVAR
jgi:hypothetical protein